MRFILYILTFLFVSCSKGQEVPNGSNQWTFPHGKWHKVVTPVDSPEAYIIVITGQSNANSHGGNLTSFYTIDPDNTSHWDSTTKAFEPHDPTPVLENGLEVQTAGLISEQHGDSAIYIIRVAQGSLAISNWDSPSGSMWVQVDSAITQGLRYLRSQGRKPVLLSTIWLQGEQDATVGTPSATYQIALQNFVNDFRSIDAIMDTSHFVLVKLTVGSGGGTYDPNGVTNVNTAMTNVAAASDNVEIVVPEDIGATLSDTVHFTYASFILIANAWFALIN